MSEASFEKLSNTSRLKQCALTRTSGAFKPASANKTVNDQHHSRTAASLRLLCFSEETGTRSP